MHLMTLWLLIGMFAHPAVHGEVIRFDRAAKGDIPPGWGVAMTHAGGRPQWEIVRDDSAPPPPMVLAQVSRDATAGRFPLAIWERATVRNGEGSVAFQAVCGEGDSGGGDVL